MNTGEDTQALRKIMDFSRLISIFILAVHFYLSCYSAFLDWGFTSEISDRIMHNLAKISWFTAVAKPKLAALIFLLISLVGVKGRKDEKADLNVILFYLILGGSVYTLSYFLFLFAAG